MSVMLGLAATPVQAQGRQLLLNHVPEIAKRLAPTGRLAGNTQLRIAIGLPVRNQPELDALLQQIYDPASPTYHQYLTPAQFAERFGATEADYEAVNAFARTNGLTVTATHPNRLVLSVTAAARDVEAAFHVTLRTFAHPDGTRSFYAPDVEPSLDLAVPVLHISGLDDYELPHPHLRMQPASLTSRASPRSGSGPNGTYRGSDFRAAYVPGASLDGTGQNVGVVQFDGYYTNDIATYISQAGITTSVVLTNVAVDGGVTNISQNGSSEVSLDIEMVVSMAPGVSRIFVYEAPNPSPWPDLLSRMANDNLARQLSCSWGGGGPDPTSEQIFQQMAAQGQSFFNATGDSDAFTGVISFPSDSPNITEVGGTTLSTTGPAGSYVSETVWNWGYNSSCRCYVGSSGGSSTYYSMPPYQGGTSTLANDGSVTFRNVPDVALTGDNVYVVYYNGLTGTFGGTSCAAPLWAGFMALANQQAAMNGLPSAGFINPAVYAIGKGTNYAATFHDTITGNNEWPSSPSQYVAVPGYDLCTGWGTPAGTNLINALTGVATNPYLVVVGPVVVGGNGNGTVDANECNLLYLPVQNLGGGSAGTTINATLATSTPGVSILQALSTYTNLARGGFSTNSTPFQISTSPAFTCGTAIQLALALFYADGPVTNMITLSSCECSSTQSGSLTGSSSTQKGRLTADGYPSICGAAKSCPGTATTHGNRAYDSYSFTNVSSVPICVTATVSSACTNNIFAVAYLGSFSSSSLCLKYLADIGNPPGPTGSFSFTVPASTNFTVVVHVINANSTCSGYSLTVAGLVCPGDGGGSCEAPPIITEQPQPQNVCPGSAASFSVGATGYGSLTYQWQTNRGDLTNGGHFSGVTTSNLLVSAVDGSVLASYRCVVSNQNGGTPSVAVALTTDTNRPSITCPVDVTVSANSGCSATNVALGVPLATNDNCGILTVTNNALALYPSAYPLGTNLVTWTVTDTSGNSSTCQQRVIVRDTTPPVVTLNGANPLTNECHTVFADPGATASDTCAGTLPVTTNTTLNPNAVGTYIIKYTATDPSGNAAASTRTVYIVDTSVPTITLIGANPLTNQCHASFQDPGATASDTCAGILAVTTNSTVNPNAVGAYSIWYTAADPSGNAATNTRTVYIIDTMPPTITWFTNAVVGADTNCQALMPDVTGTNYILAADNCSSVTVTQSVATNTTLGLGTNAVVLGAFDASGNVAYYTNFVLVVDQTPPTITCPADVHVTNDPGRCGAVVTYTAREGQDDCSGAVTFQTGGQASGTLFPVGRTTNTFQATDGAGNSVACSFVVTVDDAEPPVITWYTNLVMAADTNCQALMPDMTGTNYLLATDNCSVTVTQSVALDTMLNLGTNEVVLGAFDPAGNVAYCTNCVLVVDQTVPTIACPADIHVNNDPGLCGAVVYYAAPVGQDNCSGAVTIQVSGQASGTLFPVGRTTNTFQATDAAGNSAACNFVVTVDDSEPPVITWFTNALLDAGTNCQALMPDLTGTNYILVADNCGSVTVTQSVASNTLVSLGTNEIVLGVLDAVGNVGYCTNYVVVVGQTQPTITCPADVRVSNGPGECGAVVDYITPVGQDTCPGVVTVQVGGQASGTLFPVGRTTNTFRVTDGAGNAATCSFVVTVDDADPPVITWFTNVVLAAGADCEALIPDITGTNYILAVDNCGSVTVTQSVATNIVLNLGTNEVVLGAFDPAGNVAYCTNYVLVVDQTPPSVSCPPDMTVTAADPTGAVVSYVVSATDNCDPSPTLVVNPASGSFLPAGTNAVICTASDASGNTNSCSFLVVVRYCPPLNITLLSTNGTAQVQVCWPDTGDSCALQTAADLTAPVQWQPAGLPVMTMPDGSRCVTIMNLGDAAYYRLCGSGP